MISGIGWGSRLALPQHVWGEWGPKIHGNPDRPETRGGLASLVMQQRDRDDGYRGFITARTEPSVMFPNDGVFMEINDHYAIADADETVGSERAIEIIEKQWESSITRSEWIIDQTPEADEVGR